MMTACPHCGGALGAPSSNVHRGELERQTGDQQLAHELRERAAGVGEKPIRISAEFIAWRGYVWAKVRLRKAAACVATGVGLPAGAWAYRQLSEVRDRDLRVSADAWKSL